MDIIDGALGVRFPGIFEGQYPLSLNTKCSMSKPKVMLTKTGIMLFPSSLVANTALTANEVMFALPPECYPAETICVSVYCTGFGSSTNRVLRILNNGNVSFLSSAVTGTGTVWLNGLSLNILGKWM